MDFLWDVAGPAPDAGGWDPLVANDTARDASGRIAGCIMQRRWRRPRWGLSPAGAPTSSSDRCLREVALKAPAETRWLPAIRRGRRRRRRRGPSQGRSDRRGRAAARADRCRPVAHPVKAHRRDRSGHAGWSHAQRESTRQRRAEWPLPVHRSSYPPANREAQRPNPSAAPARARRSQRPAVSCAPRGESPTRHSP